jgi:pSer/pThr/pTyr-binding forkhead associated (FHA) protein
MKWKACIAAVAASTIGLSASGTGGDHVRESVVRLFIFPSDKPGSVVTGSGFVVNDRGTIVTNQHVIAAIAGKPGARARVLYSSTADIIVGHIKTMDDLKTEIAKLPEATVLDSDKTADIAILTPSSPGQVPALTLAPIQFVNPGDRVRAFGYPGINDDLAPSAWATMSEPSGVINGRFRWDEMQEEVYAVTVQMGHGMSGGPLVNDCGEAVAINGEGLIHDFSDPDNHVSDIERMAYSIVIDALIPMLQKHELPYTPAPARCAELSSSGPIVVQGRDPLLTGGVAASLVLGIAAVVLASTRRGRTAVKNATDAVSRRLSGQSNKGSRPPVGKVQPSGGGPGSADQLGSGIPKPSAPPLLYGVSGEYAGVELELSDQPIVIGRDPRVSQLVMSDTPAVSGRHCSIRFDSARHAVMLEDLWSTNGTFLESGKRVPGGEPTAIRSAEQFYLADPDVLFEVRY